MSEPIDSEKARQASARRRNLTIVFADLSGSTQLAAAMEAEDYAELLGQLRGIYESVIPQHGGTLARIQGDGVLAVFGYPDASEDDARRATEAALALHEQVRALRSGALPASLAALRLHTGIHSGLVLLQEGDGILGRFELLGNAANIAARLSDRAAPGEILVSDETLGPERHLFETAPVRRLRLDGVQDPISVHAVLARASVRTRFEAHARRGLTPFIGRQHERDQLQHCLDEVGAGKAQHLVISAPAGTGKTRLAEEFLASAAGQGWTVLRGYCENNLSAEPLQPFLQMLRAMFRLTHSMTPAEAEQAIHSKLDELGPKLRGYASEILRTLSFSTDQPKRAVPEAASRQANAVATHELLAALVAKAPTILFADDWQWADDASRKVLRTVLRFQRGPLLVLLATREPATHPTASAGAQILTLAPFAADEAAQTIATLLPQTDPFLIADIHRYSGGNPLFIEELCHSAAHEEMDRRLVRMHGGAPWLNVLIESRLARLPEAQANVVRAAAVVGNVVPIWLLERITEGALDDPSVQGLAEQDFLFAGEAAETLRFKHGITRDVIYDSVGLHQRRAMHLRIADALKQHRVSQSRDEALEALAYHYGAAGRPADAAHYAELAGDKAMAASALDRAKTQYHAALAALDALGPSQEIALRWLSISQRLGMVCVFDAARGDLPVFHRAVELAGEINDQVALARAHYWLGYIHHSLGEAQAAIAHCDRSLAVARSAGEDQLVAHIRATLGEAHTSACNYPKALGLLDDAIRIRRQYAGRSRPAAIGLAFSLACKGWILGDRGEFGAAYECIDEAKEVTRGVTHEIVGSINGWHGGILLWQGNWEAASQAAAESGRIAVATHSLFQFSMAQAIGAYGHWMLRGRPESLGLLLDSTSWMEARESSLYRSFIHGWLADGLVTSFRVTEARHQAAKALMRGRQRDLLGVAMAYRALARVAASLRDDAGAQRYIERAFETARARNSAHERAVTQLCHAGIRRELGDRPGALRLLDQAMPDFERMGMAWHLASAEQLRRQL